MKIFRNVYHEPTLEELAFIDTNTRIAFDLDSVLNTGDYLINHVRKSFGLSPDDDVRLYDPYYGFEKFHFSIPGIAGNEIARVVTEAVIQESASALPSAFMHKVMQHVHLVTQQPIFVVTARSVQAAEVTNQWLDEWLVDIPYLVYMVKGHSEKLKYLQHHCIKAFVDDRYKTVAGLAGKIFLPIMYKQPWNRGREKITGAIEIDDLRSVIPIVDLLYKLDPCLWPGDVQYPKPYGERSTKKYASIR